MNSSDSNTFYPQINQNLPNKMYQKGLQVDRQRKLSLKETWWQFMFRKKVIDYKKNLKCYQSSRHKMVESCHQKIQTNHSEKKHIQDKK